MERIFQCCRPSAIGRQAVAQIVQLRFQRGQLPGGACGGAQYGNGHLSGLLAQGPPRGRQPDDDLSLVAFGAWIAVDGFRKEGERIGSFPWRAIVLLSVGFSTFAWSIDNLGFIPALAILIAATSLAGADFRWREIAVEMVVLIAGCWAIFIYGLELPFPLFWYR